MAAVLLDVENGDQAALPRKKRPTLRSPFLTICLPLFAVSLFIYISASIAGHVAQHPNSSSVREALSSISLPSLFASSDPPGQISRTPHSGPRTPVTLLFDKEPNNFGHSIFLTGATSRFGSDALEYRVVDVDTARAADTPWTASIAEPGQAGKREQKGSGIIFNHPCLLVTSRPRHAFPWRLRHVPHCRVFLIKDEFCNATLTSDTSAPVDFRQYDGESDGSGLYLPLGPRIDFWQALNEAVAEEALHNPRVTLDSLDSFRQLPTHLRPASRRRHALNAVFSRDTSTSRQALAKVLESQAMKKQGFLEQSKIQIASAWSKNLDAGHMTPSEYVNILRTSVFTLAPAGHNAESYRLFEAAEAGSIPIIALDEVYEEHECSDSLKMMRKSAPKAIVWLNSWDELPDTLELLMSDKVKLDEMQRELRLWYETFMVNRIRTFETSLLSFVSNEDDSFASDEDDSSLDEAPKEIQRQVAAEKTNKR